MSAESSREGWRRCSSCRAWIPFRTAYWVCSVSTCNRRNTAFVFCSVDCWDAHLPTMNHREAWAEEKRSPSAAEWERQMQAAGKARPARRSSADDRPGPAQRSSANDRPGPPRPPAPRASPGDRPQTVLRRGGAAGSSTAASTGGGLADEAPEEILIVASRLKEYIRVRSGGMNTSERVLRPLSAIVREACDEAIRAARRAERKTVLDRDVPPALRDRGSAGR